jgi:hypothetical protein
VKNGVIRNKYEPFRIFPNYAADEKVFKDTLYKNIVPARNIR